MVHVSALFVSVPGNDRCTVIGSKMFESAFSAVIIMIIITAIKIYTSNEDKIGMEINFLGRNHFIF